jgi:hypothetical protein
MVVGWVPLGSGLGGGSGWISGKGGERRWTIRASAAGSRPDRSWQPEVQHLEFGKWGPRHASRSGVGRTGSSWTSKA